jgi:DNA-binding transcriptional MerR regulator
MSFDGLLQQLLGFQIMIAMKPQQLAKLLNVAPNTVRQWAREDFYEFLSPTAQGGQGAHRSFNDIDARILAWVALMKAQNLPVNEIRMTLKTAQSNGWRDLPPLPGGIVNDEPISVVPREAVEERVKALQERYEIHLQTVIKERDELKNQVDTLKRDLELARHETAEGIKTAQLESAQALRAMQQETTETIKVLQSRIVELTAQEAELRGRLRQYTFGGHQWNVAVLIAVALSIGIVITILILVVGSLLPAR